MAYLATAASGIATQPSLASRALHAIAGYVIRYGEKRAHFAEIEALSRLTDEELAAKGMTRDEILRSVFAANYYL